MKTSSVLIVEKKEEIKKLKQKLKIYKKGFQFLLEYFNSISAKEQKKVDKKLTKLGL